MDYSSHQLDEVRRFYTEVLGLKDFALDASMNYLLVTTGPSSSLGFMPPLEGPAEDWRPPREPNIYLFVEDVDRAHALLVKRDVEFLDAPRDMPWGHRVARLRDPEGRMVCLASAVKKG
jgi:predicted enzyme related to lactoylglutathione lyase